MAVPALVLGIAVAVSAREVEPRNFLGCCDASAVAPVDETHFAAASDEDNVLRLYRRDSGGLPVAVRDLSSFLGLGRKVEGDFEGAARVGELIFWIGSHSRNGDGRLRPGRHTLVATRVRSEDGGGRVSLEPVGRPYTGLTVALASEPALARFDLGQAAARAGEAAGGLNIEGLSSGPGESLLVGFRNPVPEGRALIVPVANPRAVIEGESPRFGGAILLDLGGLGIRDFTRVGDRYLIIAGPAEGGGRHRLFVWSGGPADRPEEVAGAVPKGFQAEGVLAVGGPDSRRLDLLSDDGSEKIKGTGLRCEELKDPARRAFRAVQVGY